MGKVLAQNVGIGVVLAEIDLNYLSVLREDFPVWSHRKISVKIIILRKLHLWGLSIIQMKNKLK